MKISRLATLSIAALVVSVAAHVARAEGGAASVTLTGQVVCSSCWSEADRTKVPYGDEGDLTCAARCARRGVPGALAVTEGDRTTLYILEDGRLSLTASAKDWSVYAGKRVVATGSARREGDKRFLKVDSLEVLPAKN